MSTRHLLNLSTGVVAVLLVASLGFVIHTLGGQDHSAVRREVLARQQILVQDLSLQVTALTQAGSLNAVNQTRQEMGLTILAIDQNLAALLHGGTLTDEADQTVTLPKISEPQTRLALENAAELWLDTGLALANLAAGEFSVFSAAGQQAVTGLQDNQAALVTEFGQASVALSQSGQKAGTPAALARWILGGLLLAMAALLRLRFRPVPITTSSKSGPARVADPSTAVAQPAGSAPLAPQATDPVGSEPREWSGQSHQAFTSPVDFDNVNASVDQMSVDMNTIAGSTDKMRLAIDSVGHAMQGMLYSLNEMAQDTAEGYKIVRGANNAASFTATAAEDLVNSAREMARVVARVTQLAVKTKQVAGQIEAEAVSTGRPGETFTSVVAAEVKGLAAQTSHTTAGIEQTVSEILSTARQYEEAIGQIIKNISAINKVSVNLGQLMLEPPAVGVAGTPLNSTPALPLAAPTPAPQPVAQHPVAQPAPAAPAEMIIDEAVADEPSIEELAAETTQAIDDAMGTPEAEPVTDPMIGGEPAAPVETVAPTAAAAPAPKTDKAEAEAEAEPAGSNGNVFMLGGARPKQKPAPAAEPAAEAPAAPTPAVEEPVAADTPAEAPQAEASPAPADDADDSGNIFMLNKPKKAPAEAPAPAVEEPVAADTPAETPAEAAQDEAPTAEAEEDIIGGPEPETADEEPDGGGNIFMLNKPKKKSGDEPAPAEAPPAAEADAELVTVPAEEEAPAEDSGSNIFMLKKPKK